MTDVANPFFDRPILNSPYRCPEQHWELDEQGQPTQKVVHDRRRAEFISPIPKPKKRSKKQLLLVDDEGLGLSTPAQLYSTSVINEVRQHVAEWRASPQAQWLVTPLALTDRLPAESAEALLELATGGKPRPQRTASVSEDPFEHPDAQRRFRVMTTVEELTRALEYPWDKWTVFLHPEQRQWVSRDYNGPARVSGSAGTGKTVVALHRAAHLARANPEARVLLTIFSDTLAHVLHTKLKRLLSSEPRIGERIDVYSLAAIGARLYNSHIGKMDLANCAVVRQLIRDAAKEVEGHKFNNHLLITEWDQAVDAWQLASWESYRDVARLDRRTRLPEAQRAILRSIYEKVRAASDKQGAITTAQMFTALAQKLSGSSKPVFDFIVVDEAQDTSIAQLRFLATLGAERPNALFFVGDLGQRIFQQPFSWKSLGVDIRGRSRNLRVKYRTSHQISSRADRLLGPEVSDADGNVEERNHTISVFNGPPPTIQQYKNEQDESQAVGQWITQQTQSGLAAHEFGVFVRSAEQLDRARAAAEATGLPYKVLDNHVATASGHVSIATMELAKGLEFRAVTVMACDDEVIPLQERIESVGDEAEIEEVYNTERHLLYVACTRARDHLLITCVAPASEFIDDMKTQVR